METFWSEYCFLLDSQPQDLADLCYWEGSISLSLPGIWSGRCGRFSFPTQFRQMLGKHQFLSRDVNSKYHRHSIIWHSSCPQETDKVENDSFCSHPYKHSGPLVYSAKGRRTSLSSKAVGLVVGGGWVHRTMNSCLPPGVISFRVHYVPGTKLNPLTQRILV